jgi:hypothetical protein
VQELAEWDDRRHASTRTSTRDSVFSLKNISRSLAAVRKSPVMIPMLQSFQVGQGLVTADPSSLDSVVSIAGIDEEVNSSSLMIDIPAYPTNWAHFDLKGCKCILL